MAGEQSKAGARPDDNSFIWWSTEARGIILWAMTWAWKTRCSRVGSSTAANRMLPARYAQRATVLARRDP
jgi:hypothetical protein